MELFRTTVLVSICIVSALVASTAILILTPGPVFERLLFSGLVFPLFVAGFAIYLKWHNNLTVSAVVVAGICTTSIVIILLGAPIH